VNGIAPYLLLTALDQEDGGQNEEPSSNRREPDVPEVVPEQDEDRYQRETNPSRPASDCVSEPHDRSWKVPYE
jgi:hypothetical protein